MKKACVLPALAVVLALAFSPAVAELSRGSRGDDVRHLQSMLMDLGFLHDKADGIFGRKTQAAVGSLQRYLGVEETGVADEGVINDLEILWRMAMGVVTEPGAPVSDEDYPPFCRRAEDSDGYTAYCWRHIDAYPIALQLSAGDAPEALERMLAGRICGMWYVGVCAMYMEWAEALGEDDRHIALEQMAEFEAELERRRAVFNRQYGEDTAAAMAAEAIWLERTGVDLCFSLHGNAPGRE